MNVPKGWTNDQMTAAADAAGQALIDRRGRDLAFRIDMGDVHYMLERAQHAALAAAPPAQEAKELADRQTTFGDEIDGILLDHFHELTPAQEPGARGREAVERLARYADSCCLMLAETHPGKAEALASHVASVKQYLEATPPAAPRGCSCSLRTKLVGDGCDVCNPSAAPRDEAERNDLRDRAEDAESTLETLRGIVFPLDEEGCLIEAVTRLATREGAVDPLLGYRTTNEFFNPPAHPPTSYAIELADGTIWPLGWRDYAEFRVAEKMLVLREGARFVFAYRQPDAPRHVDSSGCWCEPTPHTEGDTTIWEHHDRSERT